MRSMKRQLSLKFLALAVLASSCGTEDLPDYFLLDRLRVFAANVVGAAAEFSAGTGGITVDFHVSDPKGNGRTLTYAIETCVDPGVGLGVTPSCVGNPTRTSLITGGSFVAGSAATSFYGVLTTPAFAVPAAGIIYLDPTTGLARPTYEQANGVGYLVILTLAASATETTTSFKRVIVSTKATKNQNPAFGSPALLFAGVDAAAYPLTTSRFTVNSSVAVGSAEAYSLAKADGTADAGIEKLTITWLVSSGEIKYTRTDPGYENRFTPESPLPAKTSFIAVLRDDRGGMAVLGLHKP